MFKVEHRKYRGTILRVYATKTGDDGETYFLFYDGDWSWRKANDYKPYFD